MAHSTPMNSDRLTPTTFRRLARDLLDADATPGVWFESANQLHGMLSTAAGLDDPQIEEEKWRETLVPGGKALSPMDAGRCLVDLARTRAFLQGLSAAIVDRRALHPERFVHLLYAGCGPFATLALPLTNRFGPEDLRFTLIDLHEASVRGVERIVTTLGLEAHVVSLLRADATVLEVPAEPAVDILLVEAMQRALTREPQVAITRSLLSQLPAGVILIPESITLRACLANLGAEVSPQAAEDSAGPPPRNRVELGTVFEVRAERARTWESSPANNLPAGSVRLPRTPRAGEDLVIATSVRVYDGFELRDYDSGITFPEIVADASPLQAGSEIAFAYRLDPPGLSLRSGSYDEMRTCHQVQCQVLG